MNIEDVLQDLRNNLSRDYVCSGIIGLDGMQVAFDSVDSAQDGIHTAAELADGVRDVMEILKEIKSGRLYYLNIATDKFKIFILPIGTPSKYFCLLIIKGNGNMGKAILGLEKAEKLLQQEMGTVVK